MNANNISNRHTAGGGIQGEWSNKTTDRPLTPRDLLVSACVLGAAYLAVCLAAAAGI